jgi:uncharacterized membrane protein
VDALDNAMQPLRKVHAALLVAMVLYVIIGERIRPQEPKDVGLVATALVIVGIITAGGTIFLRRLLMQPAEQALRTRQDDAALNGWCMGSLVSLVLCEAVALYGFISRVLGGPIQHALLLYAGGFVLLILFTPRRPS